MKKAFKKLAILLMVGVLAMNCAGCAAGTIYGKPLDSLEETDKTQGLVFAVKIMEAMQSGTLDDVNQLGYHYGEADAETFEDFWADWEALKPEYGQIKAVYPLESYKYGNELVFVFEAEMEKGELRMSAMFTDEFEMVMLFLYETPAAVQEKLQLPEGVIEQDIVIGEGTDYEINGKITMPEGAAEGDGLKAVVLVGGDGPNTMDLQSHMEREESGQMMYRDLAWGLAEQGIVSIRYDKRTATEEYREQRNVTDADPSLHTVAWEYTDDAILATELLKAVPCVDATQVYIVGHSESGVLAPRIDEEGGDYAGLILISSSPRPWYDVIHDQYINYGLVDQDDESIYYLVSKVDMEKEMLDDADYEDMSEEDLVNEVVMNRFMYYWKDMLGYDYVGRIKEVQKPVLILQGEANFQVKRDVDFNAWQKEMGAEPYVTMKAYEGLNHYLIESTGCFYGHSKEYEMPGFVSEEVIQDIASWIENKTVSE